MKMKIVDAIIGILASNIVLVLLLTLGDQSSYEVYTTSRFTNFIEIFMVLGIGALVAELCMNKTLREFSIDILIIFAIAYFSNKHFINSQGIFLFAGDLSMVAIGKKLLVPEVISAIYYGIIRDGFIKWMTKK